MPLQKSFFKGLSHPWVPATFNRLRNCQPTSFPAALFWPTVKLFLHKQSEHGSSTQTFWTELVLKCFAFKGVVSQEMLEKKRHKSDVYMDYKRQGKDVISTNASAYKLFTQATYLKIKSLPIKRGLLGSFMLTSKTRRTWQKPTGKHDETSTSSKTH